MSTTSEILYKRLKVIYDKCQELQPDLEPHHILMNSVAGFINHTFPNNHYAQLMSNVVWLQLAVEHPSAAGWLMESMDQPLVTLCKELTDAINEVYLEIR